MSGLENGDRVAVANTSVSPHCTMQEPEACSAQFVVFTLRILPPISISKVSFITILAAKYELVRICQKVLET